MEDQTHLTLGKKNKSSSPPPWRPDTLGRKTRGGKKKEEEKTNSFPSLRERSETPGALDRHVHWESEETPVAQSHLSALVRITGYRCFGCRPGSSRIDSVHGGRTCDPNVGEATFRSHSAMNEPSQLSAKTVFIFNI